VFLIVVRKASVAVSLLLFVLFCFASPTYAGESAEYVGMEMEASTVEIDPFWSHTTLITANLTFNNSGRATISGSVVGNSGTSHIIGNAVLDRVNPNGSLTRIASFNNIRAEGNVWLFSRPHYVARGHNYRVTITSTVFRNGATETLSLSSGVAFAP